MKPMRACYEALKMKDMICFRAWWFVVLATRGMIHGLDVSASPVEVRVLRLLCTGRTNEEIGREVYLSASTVKQLVTGLMGKLGASNRVTLAVRAAELGLN